MELSISIPISIIIGMAAKDGITDKELYKKKMPMTFQENKPK